MVVELHTMAGMLAERGLSCTMIAVIYTSKRVTLVSVSVSIRVTSNLSLPARLPGGSDWTAVLSPSSPHSRGRTGPGSPSRCGCQCTGGW